MSRKAFQNTHSSSLGPMSSRTSPSLEDMLEDFSVALGGELEGGFNGSLALPG